MQRNAVPHGQAKDIGNLCCDPDFILAGHIRFFAVQHFGRKHIAVDPFGKFQQNAIAQPCSVLFYVINGFCVFCYLIQKPFLAVQILPDSVRQDYLAAPQAADLRSVHFLIGPVEHRIQFFQQNQGIDQQRRSQ
nr:hypothetical protein [uncultured Acetatifactor sp.]